jgi:hypothetical protein
MKKTLIALAALGVVGAASAQVSISGGVAAGIQNKIGASTAKWHMTNADITFSANEDLGGGLAVKASTTISNEALWGNGTQANNTTLSISGGFGSIAYDNVLSGAAKMGSPSAEDDLSDVLGGYSKLNVATYTTPQLLPGLTASMQWSATDNADLEFSGTPTLFANYATGPMTFYVDNGGDTKVWDVRATYDFGAGKVGFRQDKEKIQELALTMPLGALTAGIYSVKGKNGEDGAGLSAAYALSKRTSLTFGYVSSKKSANFTGKAVADTSGGNNYRLNLAHSF